MTRRRKRHESEIHMATLRFEKIEPVSGRILAIVGDAMSAIIGAAGNSHGATSTWNVTDQPSGSDIFSGLGTGGSDVPFSSLGSATFVVTGYYQFSVSAANGDKARVTAICFPAAALEVARIKFQNQSQHSAKTRTNVDRRNILRALAMAATQAGVETALEGGAAVAPFHGTRPSVLGAGATDDMRVFGSW